MKLVVHDASILIDLALSETVDAWFATGIETWTTDLIYPLEIDRPIQRAELEGYVRAGKLKLRKLMDADIEKLRQLKTKERAGLSMGDLSVLMFARELGSDATLATGDRALRAVATRDGVNACGLLGLFDLMVKPPVPHAPALPVDVAIAKLRRLMSLPECRLPSDRCEARMRSWVAGA